MSGIALTSVETYLKARGLDPTLKVHRGMPTSDVLSRGQQRMVILTRAGGMPLRLEQEFDQPLVTVRVVGRQGDYDDAEALADQLDKLMLCPTNVQVGAVRALYVTRLGGAMTPVMFDTAKRTHFQASYVIPVPSGV